MIKIILSTHGKMAEGMVNTMQMLIGKEYNVDIIPFFEDTDAEDLENKFKKEISKMQTYENLLILCDLKGGTPFNIASKVSFKNSKIAVLYGVNLPILIEALTTYETQEFSEYIKNIEKNIYATLGVSKV